MSRPKLLDGCCCQGGAGTGYALAGFDVTGVDNEPQPRYPLPFIQADIVEYIAAHGHEYDVIHVSPPCPLHSAITPAATRARHPDMIDPTRTALVATGLPYVIENVPGAPLRSPMVLCGASFGLGTVCRDGIRRHLRRHRLFESNVWLMSPGCACSGEAVGVYGDGGGGPSSRPSGGGGYKAFTEEARAAMGIDWMDRHGIANAIPPAYTQFIGEQLLAALNADGAVA